MKMRSRNSGATLVEIIFTTILIGVVGLVIYTLLNIGTILASKNIAVNTAHQQARTAMLQMVSDLHGSVSLPQLVDVNGNPSPTPDPSASPTATPSSTPAAGIAFQLWSSGPHKVTSNVSVTQKAVTISSPSTITPVPTPGQRLIIPGHGIEDDITAVAQVSNSSYILTLANNVKAAIDTSNGNIPCFITDRCSYIVKNQQLEWVGPTTKKTFAVMGRNITSPTPFSVPVTASGALYHRFVAAIDLTTSDLQFSNRGFKSANILLNGQVPLRTRLTVQQ
jgi:type II secretory pathway pseudopilin PulG